jgi:hypothetical protein
MSLVGFDLISLKFNPPFVKFQIDANDSICSFHIGPVVLETLTRFAFIHTKAAMRVISLETASEVVNDTFPFKTRGAQNFAPLLSALCPSQRMFAFGSVDDTRIVLYDLLCNSSSNSSSSSSSNSDTFLTRDAVDALRSDPQYLRQLAVSTRGGLSSSDSSHFNRFERTLVEQFLLEIVMDCLEAASLIVEAKTTKKLKEDYLKGFYGNDMLGVVKPTSWPDPISSGDVSRLYSDEGLAEYGEFLEKGVI